MPRSAGAGMPAPAPAGAGSNGLPPEQSGKLAMVRQAKLDVDRAEGVLFDKEGKLRKDVVLMSKAPGGGLGQDARLANTYIRNAVSAKYRMETGAAGNQAEVDDIMSRFMPSVLDNDKTAKDKINRLREFMDMSLETMKGQGLVSKGAPSTSAAEDPLGIRK